MFPIDFIGFIRKNIGFIRKTSVMSFADSQNLTTSIQGQYLSLASEQHDQFLLLNNLNDVAQPLSCQFRSLYVDFVINVYVNITHGTLVIWKLKTGSINANRR